MLSDCFEHAESALKIPDSWAGLRVAVLGLGRSGRGAARLLRRAGASVYASDFADSEELREGEAELRAASVEVELGGHDVKKLQASEMIVVSPGIPPNAHVLRQQGVSSRPMISELELAFNLLRSPVIAVTGTNGKTTTTAWIGDMIERSGLRVGIGGNIGEPLSDLALSSGERHDWVVAEVSSFQLAHTVNFSPAIGVFLNLGIDHLDRYESVEQYHQDKARIFANASAESCWILNGDDGNVLALSTDRPGVRRYFRIATPLAPGEEGAWVTESGQLRMRMGGVETELVAVDELRTLGMHNVANGLAASIAATQAGVPEDFVRESLRRFEPLPHRSQPIAEQDGVLWVNDSKATNIAATRVAIRSLDRPIVLLLGGRGKGETFADLASDVASVVRAVVAYGEAAEQIESELSTATRVVRIDGPFEAVVERAGELAVPGDAVLLAPACASFDMFRDYAERGVRFARLVKERGS